MRPQEEKYEGGKGQGGNGHKKNYDERNILLVVVTLIAAVTFQAGVNPPGGVWQEKGCAHKEQKLQLVANQLCCVEFEEKAPVQDGANPPDPDPEYNCTGKPHEAGHAIYASKKVEFYIFLICNTLALSASILVILSMMRRLAHQLEVYVATISMIVTYASSIFAVTPHNFFLARIILLTGFLPYVIRLSIYLCNYFLNKIKDYNKIEEARGTQHA